MFIPSPNGDFELAPAGTHLATCYRVIDLGTQETRFDGKRRHQVRVTWELDEMMKNGNLFSVSKTYTWSMNKRAALRQHLEAWRGKPFADKDFGPGGFDIKNILGKSCLITVAHEKSQTGDDVAYVGNVGPLMKGQQSKPPVSPAIYLWLEPGLFSKEVFELLHEKTREQIAKSPEYVAIINNRPLQPAESENPAPDDVNDEVPF